MEAAAVAWIALSLALAYNLAAGGLRRGSLAPSGAAAAWAMGSVHLACGIPYGLTLIFFYFTSSKLTRWKSSLKASLEVDHREGGQRTAVQVLANSLVGALCALGATWLGGTSSSGGGHYVRLVDVAFCAFYACCTGDTWSSEVGIASRHPPRLITTLRRVPPGTNGGVSMLGIVAASAGGLMVGAVFAGSQALVRGGVAHGDLALLPLAVMAAVFGSALDSFLGATLQYSGLDEGSNRVVSGPAAIGSGRCVRWISGVDLLSNSSVNVLASVGTTAMTAVTAQWLMPRP